MTYPMLVYLIFKVGKLLLLFNFKSSAFLKLCLAFHHVLPYHMRIPECHPQTQMHLPGVTTVPPFPFEINFGVLDILKGNLGRWLKYLPNGMTKRKHVSTCYASSIVGRMYYSLFPALFSYFNSPHILQCCPFPILTPLVYTNWFYNTAFDHHILFCFVKLKDWYCSESIPLFENSLY